MPSVFQTRTWARKMSLVEDRRGPHRLPPPATASMPTITGCRNNVEGPISRFFGCQASALLVASDIDRAAKTPIRPSGAFNYGLPATFTVTTTSGKRKLRPGGTGDRPFPTRLTSIAPPPAAFPLITVFSAAGTHSIRGHHPQFQRLATRGGIQGRLFGVERGRRYGEIPTVNGTVIVNKRKAQYHRRGRRGWGHRCLITTENGGRIRSNGRPSGNDDLRPPSTAICPPMAESGPGNGQYIAVNVPITERPSTRHRTSEFWAFRHRCREHLGLLPPSRRHHQLWEVSENWTRSIEGRRAISGDRAGASSIVVHRRSGTINSRQRVGDGAHRKKLSGPGNHRWLIFGAAPALSHEPFPSDCDKWEMSVCQQLRKYYGPRWPGRRAIRAFTYGIGNVHRG